LDIFLKKIEISCAGGFNLQQLSEGTEVKDFEKFFRTPNNPSGK
jgi:hypothetical protein